MSEPSRVLRLLETRLLKIGGYPISWKSALSCAAFASALFSAGVKPAWTDETNQPTTTSMLDMAGPLAANQNPTVLDAGPLGNVYVSGALSGLAQWQTSVMPGARGTQADLSNGQVFIQKTDGVLQFFVQAGVYSLPALGTPYVNAMSTTRDFYGPLPQTYIKLVPNDEWSIMAGKLPSLAGLEYTFSFQNMNIERGLLWNQTSSISRGVQINHSAGPIFLALSWNDGFYSDRPSWLSGSATWKVNTANTLAFVWATNTRTTTVSTKATPVFQNNSEIYNLIYTHTLGSWTITPYLQYTYIARIPSIGALHDAATYGAALLMNYTFDSAFKVGGLSFSGFSLPVRAEYIASSGSVAEGAPNLLYGPGSAAWSVTVTPTYQYKTFFTRAEFSYVGAIRTTPGLAFGPTGSNTGQARFLLESGVLF